MAKDLTEGKISESEMTEELFASYLSTWNIPDPELMIRMLLVGYCFGIR